MTARTRPTVPGRVEGVVSLDPWTVQCSRCGHTETGNLSILTGGIDFHDPGAPRLCLGCRRDVFAGCGCLNCADDRKGQK